jgi:hypothetical protein
MKAKTENLQELVMQNEPPNIFYSYKNMMTLKKVKDGIYGNWKKLQ